MAGSFVAAKGFISLNNLGGSTGSSAPATQGTGTKGPKVEGGRGGSGQSHYGGRVDVTKTINEIKFVLSLTDASVKTVEQAPKIEGVILTGQKQINDNLNLTVGYDAGAQNVLVSAAGDTDVSGKTVAAKATWFSVGNHVRAEASARLDSRNTIWGSYTLNDTSNIANSTFNTIKEREGFIISPFTIPISTSAVKYTLEKDGYKVEPAFDIATRSPFLSVEKFLSDKNVLAKASYAFRDEVAMLEFGYRPDEKDFPLARTYVKGPLGQNGVGPISAGFILDKSIEL